MAIKLKLSFGGVLRRITVPEPLTFSTVAQLAAELYDCAAPHFTYQDDEGDTITASSDSELREAAEMPRGDGLALRLDVVVPQATAKLARSRSRGASDTCADGSGRDDESSSCTVPFSYCAETLCVTGHENGDVYDGVYRARPSAQVNNAPLYELIHKEESASGGQVQAQAQGQATRATTKAFVFRHPCQFTRSGFVWVLQPLPPPAVDGEAFDGDWEWRANAYGVGDTEPWDADWGHQFVVKRSPISLDSADASGAGAGAGAGTGRDVSFSDASWTAPTVVHEGVLCDGCASTTRCPHTVEGDRKSVV